MEKKYIDAEALLKWYDDERKIEYDRLSEYKKPSSRTEAKLKIGVLDKLYFKICELKEQGSAADVQEVKHGEWVIEEAGDGWKRAICPHCLKVFLYAKGHYQIGIAPYCPACGAKMDGGKSDGD